MNNLIDKLLMRVTNATDKVHPVMFIADQILKLIAPRDVAFASCWYQISCGTCCVNKTGCGAACPSCLGNAKLCLKRQCCDFPDGHIECGDWEASHSECCSYGSCCYC